MRARLLRALVHLVAAIRPLPAPCPWHGRVHECWRESRRLVGF